MKKKVLVIIGITVALSFGYEGLYGVVSGGTIHQFTPRSYGDADWLYFSNGIQFDVTVGEPEISRDLTLEKSDYYLVHCVGPVYSEHVRTIESTGAKVYSYIPNYTFLVKMDETSKNNVQNIGFVNWIGIYHPAYKISNHEALRMPRGRQDVTIILYPDANVNEVLDFLTSRGAMIKDFAESRWEQLINCELNLSHLHDVARLEQVNWIEPWYPDEIYNNQVQWILQTGASGNRRIWNMGITGEGQLLSTCDTGIRTSHYAFRNTSSTWITTWGDYPADRKVIGYHPASGLGAGYNDFGDEMGNYCHGTHVSGTACGDDDVMGSPSDYDGVGIDSRIYFLDGGGSLGCIYTYSNINDLFILPYNGNAAGSVKMISNSWGQTALNGVYNERSAQVDQFMWDHPDFLAFFSNGNEGPGVMTVHPPATAKNCVSVGGCRNGAAYQSIYQSSSRGPTQDGRYKPTIIAPAQTVTSAFGASDNGYWGLEGTSMAAPGALGAAVLVRQYFVEGWYPTGAANPADSMAPSAALLKAMLVNSADPSISGFTVPDNNIGWGRIDLDSVLFFSGDAKELAIVDDMTGLSTGQYVEYTYNVASSSVPFRVVLVWTDYPGTPGAGRKLVNDIHLTVTDPGSNQYKGNVYSSGQSVTGGNYDTLNVEECVRRNSPASGTWTIRVDGYNCPYGPQPFAIVVTGDLAVSAQPNVVYQSSTIDDAAGNNNGRIDPGETVDITVTLRNDGSVDATGATGTLRTSSSDITLIDSVASYGTIAASGGTAQGTFQLSAAASIPQGTVIPMTVYLEANGGAYTTNCNFQVIVGLPRADYVDHDVGNCVLTVTKQGGIGFLNQGGLGSGFIYPNPGTNQLYHASLALANAPNYVMDRFYPNTGTPNNTDWLCTTVPDGRCWIDTCTPCASDQESWAMYSDSGYTSPKSIIITQHGFAWEDPSYDDFVIAVFDVKNAGSSAVSNIHTGVIADFDMGDAYSNLAGTDVSRRLAYMWYPSSPNPYVGVKLLYPTTATNVTVLQNPVYVYNGAVNIWHDTTLYKFLNGTLSFPSGATPDDWSIVLSAAPYTLNPGDIEQVAFAFVGGTSLSDLQTNADSAQSVYDQYLGIEEIVSPEIIIDGFVKLYPNPFTKSTCMSFSLSKAANVRIKVYNAVGQLVKTVIDEKCDAGLNNVHWNSRDDSGKLLPNGIYFYSLETEGYHGTGKMIILH
jgi:hypothetical protein